MVFSLPRLSNQTFVNRTPNVRVGLVIKHNRTHNKFGQSTFDYQLVQQNTDIQFQLIFFGTFFYLFHSIKVGYDNYTCVIYLFSGIKGWIPNKIKLN